MTRGTVISARTHHARRRVSILLAGAVAVGISGCGLIEGGGEPSSTTTHAPLTTTTTTEPSSSSSTSTTSGSSKNPPSGNSILTESRQYMAATNNVTIEGTLYDEERDLTVTLRAEGSTGGLLSTSKKAGISRTTLSIPGGGSLETIAVGTDHFVKVDKAWLEVMQAPDDSPMRKNTGRWIKVPFEDSPMDAYRPQTLLQQTFYGKSLTPFDAKQSPASYETLDGQETYRVAIRKADNARGGERILWVSTEPGKPAPIRLSYGEGDRQSVLEYSKWGSSRENWKKPAGAKTLEDLSGDDL